jgi:ABC-type Fe3+-citrate transport system substrate-binding protein
MRPLNLTAEERRLAWHLVAKARLEKIQRADRARWAKARGSKGAQYRYLKDKQP